MTARDAESALLARWSVVAREAAQPTIPKADRLLIWSPLSILAVPGTGCDLRIDQVMRHERLQRR